MQEEGNLLELVDPIIGTSYSREQAMRMLNMALLCTNPSPTIRPSMSAVVSIIDGKTKVVAPIVKRTTTNDDLEFKTFEKLSYDSQTQVPSTLSQESRTARSMSSMEGPWIDSSISTQSKDPSSSKLLEDLYDVHLN